MRSGSVCFFLTVLVFITPVEFSAAAALPCEESLALIDQKTTQAILTYVWRYGPVRTSEPFAIRNGFLRLGNAISNPVARDRYQAEIMAIDWRPTDYVSMWSHQSRRSVRRLELAWQAYLEASELPQAKLPKTVETVEAAGSALKRSAARFLPRL